MLTIVCSVKYKKLTGWHLGKTKEFLHEGLLGKSVLLWTLWLALHKIHSALTNAKLGILMM